MKAVILCGGKGTRFNNGKPGPLMKNYRDQASNHSIENVGHELRGMMPWIAKNKIVDKSKN